MDMTTTTSVSRRKILWGNLILNKAVANLLPVPGAKTHIADLQVPNPTAKCVRRIRSVF